MKLLLFTIYDVLAEAYAPPYVGRTVGEALRTFQAVLQDPQLPYSKSPKDYRLYRVGEFDPMSGVVVGAKEGVVLVEEGLQLVKEA